MEYCLTTSMLCKQYINCKALNGLTMHVPKGAIYGLVGRNGAGKTTLPVVSVFCSVFSGMFWGRSTVTGQYGTS